MASAVNWFEIPVAQFDRAQRFYATILAGDVQKMDMGPTTMGFLPGADEQGVGGAIVAGEGTPSQQGTMVYLNGGADLATVLARVEGAGGKIAVPKTEIGNGYGFFAHFVDTEGNKVGLHSMG